MRICSLAISNDIWFVFLFKGMPKGRCTFPLSSLALTRSGDKGNSVNIGNTITIIFCVFFPLGGVRTFLSGSGDKEMLTTWIAWSYDTALGRYLDHARGKEDAFRVFAEPPVFYSKKIRSANNLRVLSATKTKERTQALVIEWTRNANTVRRVTECSTCISREE